MSQTDNNQPGSTDFNAPAQNPIADSFSMFNDPIPVEAFDEDEIPLSDNFWGLNQDPIEEPIQDPPQNQNPDVPGNDGEEELKFDDPIINQANAAAENKSDDDLKAELEKRGYKISKETQEDANAQRTKEIERLSTVISDAKNFLNLPSETIVKEKVRTELSREYVRTGKQHLIGTEEFQLDVDAEYEQYAQNSALLNIYASNIKTEVQNVINESEGKVKQINTEVETEQKKLLIEKRNNLQKGISAIYKSGIFGIKPTQQESNEIYNSIISGEFAKEVNSDPTLVAEFATFRKFREQINSKLGGPTYGEGVKNAAEAINGGPLKTETSLSTAVKNTAQGLSGSSEQNNRKKAWAQETVSLTNPQQSQNQQFIAGSGAGFL